MLTAARDWLTRDFRRAANKFPEKSYGLKWNTEFGAPLVHPRARPHARTHARAHAEPLGTKKPPPPPPLPPPNPRELNDVRRQRLSHLADDIIWIGRGLYRPLPRPRRRQVDERRRTRARPRRRAQARPRGRPRDVRSVRTRPQGARARRSLAPRAPLLRMLYLIPIPRILFFALRASEPDRYRAPRPRFFRRR